MSYLIEWFETYLKNRDIVHRKIVDMNKDGNDLEVKFKDKTQKFRFFTAFDSLDSEFLERNENPALVFLNTRKNLNSLIINWDKLVQFPKLCVYFVNPFSETDTRWILFPYTHNQISERKSLETGLQSMFSSVEETDLQSFEKKV